MRQKRPRSQIFILAEFEDFYFLILLLVCVVDDAVVVVVVDDGDVNAVVGVAPISI